MTLNLMLMYVCPVHVEPKSIYVVHRSAFFFSLLSVFLHWTLVRVWGISYCFWVDFPLIRAYHFIYSNTHTDSEWNPKIQYLVPLFFLAQYVFLTMNACKAGYIFYLRAVVLMCLPWGGWNSYHLVKAPQYSG